ncbi:MAG: hypothetical protein CVV64_16390 [Candidatus Wallbacteria bacterium HGW-Wallbacteria-1]|jgi:hypothetical protein|uniref:PAS domain-containing protein n=1 Tax=Candidatus Wallbacteria bacterium HGW-Wallbacteria-1 TaxID=2013854 RepID=A0A2N1PL44_9BACT|nr:MAG: hypothetical protein CVV64_16390 [Candidatus Wallbacteria bacterium HGW-Wallbacteria-1]
MIISYLNWWHKKMSEVIENPVDIAMSLMHDSKNAMVMTNDEFRIVFANRAAEIHYASLGVKELQGRSIKECHDESFAAKLDYLYEMFRGRKIAIFEAQFPAGEQVNRFSYIPVFDDTEKGEVFCGVLEMQVLDSADSLLNCADSD